MKIQHEVTEATEAMPVFQEHKVMHPKYGHVDTIAVTGLETKEELAAFEKTVFEKLWGHQPSTINPQPTE